MVRPYLKKGARHGGPDYLAQVLDAWSPEVDAQYSIHTALFEAIDRGDEEAVQMLLDAGVSPRQPQRAEPKFTPLLAASRAGQLGMARRFWTLVGPEGRADEDGHDCLGVAARNGRPELVAFFLDIWGGWTAEERKIALDEAAATRWDVCVDVLLDKLTYPQRDLQEALEWAIRKRMILMEDETGRLRREQLGSLTHHEAEADARRRQRRVISRLIDAGANPDGPGLWSKSGRLLLFAASQLDYTACLAALLEKGADARIADSQGVTALHWLLRKGPADPDRRLFWQDTPQDRMDATRLLLDHGCSPDAADEAGETALHLAAQKGSLEQLQLCLAHSQVPANGAVRQPNNQGESPLHYAAASRRHDVVEYLLAQGAADDVDLASRRG
ncbi:ankyrin repeat-containing domain protein [Apiospora sp. TS-2023a]